MLVQELGVDTSVWYAVVAGAIGGVAIGLITEYYTGQARENYCRLG